jgi:hypothetical protein
VSTITINPDTEQMALPIQIKHFIRTDRYRWVCIQPECDGEHHVWCNCRRVA